MIQNQSHDDERKSRVSTPADYDSSTLLRFAFGGSESCSSLRPFGCGCGASGCASFVVIPDFLAGAVVVAFGFFFTRTPFSDFLVSFLIIGGGAEDLLLAVVLLGADGVTGGGFAAFSRAATALFSSGRKVKLDLRNGDEHNKNTYCRKPSSSFPSDSWRSFSSCLCFSSTESRKSTSSSSRARNWFPEMRCHCHNIGGEMLEST